MHKFMVLAVCLAILPAAGSAVAAPSRVKDIATVSGLGTHKLLGYGVVAGLEGSGDSDTSALTARSIANLLEKLGLTVSAADFKAKNLAAVLVTAELPAVARVGGTLDCTVSSLADARSLQGGMLLLTPLKAADGEVYALAQGPVTVGGFAVNTRGGDAVQKNHVTVARLPGGASIVKALAGGPPVSDRLCLSLRQPDYTTAVRLATAVNQALGPGLAVAVDQATIEVTLPAEARERLLELIVTVENLAVQPDTAARVVINERTGTVVIGQQVRISPVAVCHGGLTVEVQAKVEVSQPPPLVQQAPAEELPTVFVDPQAAPPVKEVTPIATKPKRIPQGGSLTGGRTVAVRQEELAVKEESASLVAVREQATLDDLVAALNALGVKPRDLIAIIQALKEAGALQAELVLF